MKRGFIMSGHSKWHNIQGRKNAQDAKRGKIFQKLSRELYMAAKQGGPDPSGNPSSVWSWTKPKLPTCLRTISSGH